VFCCEGKPKTLEGAGSPHSVRNLQRRHFKPALKRAGVPDIRLYDCRHTCATLLLSAGVSPKIVSARLGHSSIVLTLETYTHVLPTMQESATEQLEAILRKGRPSFLFCEIMSKESPEVTLCEESLFMGDKYPKITGLAPFRNNPTKPNPQKRDINGCVYENDGASYERGKGGADAAD